MAKPQHSRLAKARPNNLQANGQPIAREAARQRERGGAVGGRSGVVIGGNDNAGVAAFLEGLLRV